VSRLGGENKMAAKKGVGITSKPPVRNSNRGVDPTKPGFGPGKNAALQKLKQDKAAQGQQLPGLTQPQNQAINQRQEADLALGGAANQMLPGVVESYSQPFDWERINQMSPVQGDWKGYVDQGVQQYNQAFDQRMNPVFQKQNEDLEQWAANTGNPVGSPAYNEKAKLLMQSQNDARTQAYAQGRSQAFGEAGQAFGIGTQAQQNQYGLMRDQRNMPMSEFNAMYAATSPMAMQNLGYSQTSALQDDAQKAQMQLMKATPRGGGGGGSDPFMGFGSASNLWAAQDARTRANAEYQMQLQQRYAPPDNSKQQMWGGLLGSIGGGLMQGWGAGGFKNPFG